jgi:hypothetical protein
MMLAVDSHFRKASLDRTPRGDAHTVDNPEELQQGRVNRFEVDQSLLGQEGEIPFAGAAADALKIDPDEPRGGGEIVPIVRFSVKRLLGKLKIVQLAPQINGGGA